MLQNPLKFTALIFVVSFGIYVLVQQGKGLFPNDTDAVFRFLVPSQFRSESSTNTTIGQSGGAAASPLAGHVRLASIAPGSENVPGQVFIVNLDAGSVDLRSWTVAGSLGSVRIGSDAGNVEHEYSLELGRPVFTQSDTARLLDAQGRLVDTYSF